MLEFMARRGNEKIFIQINDVDNRTVRGIRQGFFRLGSNLKKELNRQVLAKPKGGRLYRLRTKSGRRRNHRASAPGETPANLTGNYRRNIGFQLKGTSELEFGIRDGAPYAEFLEEGTPRMAARPGVTNAVQEGQRNAQLFLESSLNNELNKL